MPLKRKFTAFWQPRRPLFNVGYVAAEHAQAVRALEDRVHSILREHAPPALAPDVAERLLAREARMIVRWIRVSSRMHTSLRHLLQRRGVSDDVFRQVYGPIVRAGRALFLPAWSRHRPSKTWAAGAPKQPLRWPATRSPWPRR